MILSVGSSLKPCSAPTVRRIPSKSCAGSSSVGRSRSRSGKFATTRALKHYASRRRRPSLARHSACFACSFWSLCSESSSRRTPAEPQPPALGIVKQHSTFSDTLAAVRRDIWREQGFGTSSRAVSKTKRLTVLRHATTYALCHAA